MAAFREYRWNLAAGTGCPYSWSIGEGWGGKKKKKKRVGQEPRYASILAQNFDVSGNSKIIRGLLRFLWLYICQCIYLSKYMKYTLPSSWVAWFWIITVYSRYIWALIFIHVLGFTYHGTGQGRPACFSTSQCCSFSAFWVLGSL